MALSKSEKLKMCVGCELNFYNGNNPYGVKECWSLKTAKIAYKKRVPIWQPPPYDNIPAERTLSCKRCKGYAMMDVKGTRS